MVITRKKERGAALIEAAITVPIILLISVAIFDFGRAYQTWQVVTNAAREGARVSIIVGKTDDEVIEAVRSYLEVGNLPAARSTSVNIVTERNYNLPTGDPLRPTVNASRITVQYPFKFIALGPVMKLVDSRSTRNNDLPMSAVAVMRNEN